MVQRVRGSEIHTQQELGFPPSFNEATQGSTRGTERIAGTHQRYAGLWLLSPGDGWTARLGLLNGLGAFINAVKLLGHPRRALVLDGQGPKNGGQGICCETCRCRRSCRRSWPVWHRPVVVYSSLLGVCSTRPVLVWCVGRSRIGLPSAVSFLSLPRWASRGVEPCRSCPGGLRLLGLLLQALLCCPPLCPSNYSCNTMSWLLWRRSL